MKITLILFVVIVLFVYFLQNILPPSGSEHQEGLDYLTTLENEFDLHKEFKRINIQIYDTKVISANRSVCVILFLDKECSVPFELKQKMAEIKTKRRLGKLLYLEYRKGKPGSDGGKYFLKTRIE